MTRLVCLIAVIAGGCDFYFHNDPKPDAACYADPGPTQQERDPYTGQCETIGGVTCGCGGPCVYNGLAGGKDIPNWASCESPCIGTSEAACLAAPTCQAEYLDTRDPAYWGCFPLEPNGPIEPPPTCIGLDAWTCSTQGQCTATYAPSPTTTSPGATSFVSCGSKSTPPPPPACSTLTEAACQARGDCDTVYTGTNCTCDASGCTCQTETFLRCQAR